MADAAGGAPKLAPAERRLIEAYRRLTPAARRALVRHAQAEAARQVPVPASQRLHERPHGETVVHAIRRLARAYPGLDRNRLLAATSRCLAGHMLDGREASEVIGELEALFAREAAGRI